MTIENPEMKRSAERVRNYFQQHFTPQPYAHDSKQNENQQIKRRPHEEFKESKQEKTITPSKGVYSIQHFQGNQQSVAPFNQKKNSLTNPKRKSNSFKFTSERKESITKSDLLQTPGKEPDLLQKSQTKQNPTPSKLSFDPFL